MGGETNASARAHKEIKRLVMTGELAPRAHIDIDALARRLRLSSMPVRQALALLLWERLLRVGARGGYEVALWSERELADLYAWRRELMLMVAGAPSARAEVHKAAALQSYADAVSAAMRLLEKDENGEVQRAAQSADERLHLARLVEAEVLGDVESEFKTLLRAMAESSKRSRALIRAYHRRRIESARAIRQRAVLRTLASNGSGA
jgi:DNA-binding GntR family transcriptional regulator